MSDLVDLGVVWVSGLSFRSPRCFSCMGQVENFALSEEDGQAGQLLQEVETVVTCPRKVDEQIRWIQEIQ